MFGRSILPLGAVALVAGCTTTDVAPTSGDPTLLQLAELKAVESTPVADGKQAVRHTADSQGRFALLISPIDGSERQQAFGIAEQAYSRICGQSATDSTGPGEPGVGKRGTRAPYYSVEKRTYYVYMQCAGSVGG